MYVSVCYMDCATCTCGQPRTHSACVCRTLKFIFTKSESNMSALRRKRLDDYTPDELAA